MGASSSVGQTTELIKDGMTSNFVVSNEGARKAFTAFFERGDWPQKLACELPDDARMLLQHEYKLPEGDAASDFKVRSTNEVDDFFPSETLLTPVIVAALLPLFLQSKEYEEWVQLQTSGTDIGVVEQAKRIGRMKSLFSEVPHSFNPYLLSHTVVADALKSVDTVSVKAQIESGAWLESLVAVVEDLPLCVAISSADEKNKGFPLIYVNKAFEKMTGYSRMEILNQNCRFLQSARTERSQIERLSEALRLAKPVKVAITNVRKDGTEFGNLLAMKPVFDSDGVYSYVIGVQCDITDPAVSHRTTQMVEDLLSILPNIFI
eukprot:gene23240-26308_t